MICTTINNWGACCYISFKVLYFHNLSLLSAIFTEKPEIPVERTFCR